MKLNTTVLNIESLSMNDMVHRENEFKIVFENNYFVKSAQRDLNKFKMI